MPPAGPLAEVRVQVRRSAFSGTFVGDRQLAVTLQDTPGHAQVPDQSARSPVPLPPSGGEKPVEYWTCTVEGHPMQKSTSSGSTPRPDDRPDGSAPPLAGGHPAPRQGHGRPAPLPHSQLLCRLGQRAACAESLYRVCCTGRSGDQPFERSDDERPEVGGLDHVVHRPHLQRPPDVLNTVKAQCSAMLAVPARTRPRRRWR